MKTQFGIISHPDISPSFSCGSASIVNKSSSKDPLIKYLFRLAHSKREYGYKVFDVAYARDMISPEPLIRWRATYIENPEEK